MKGFAEVVEIPETKKDEKYIFGTIKNNGDSSYVTFDGSDFLTPITSAMGYEDGDRVMVMVKSHRAIVVNNMTSPAVTGKYVKENYASFDNLSATNAQIGYLRANMITTDVLEAKIGEFGYLKADVAELKFASIESLNATNAEITNLKASTITADNLSAEVAKLGYASMKDLEATTAKIDDLASKTITADNLRTEIAKIGYLTADEADIRYLTVSTANATFLHADMSDMDIAKIQTLFATAGIVSDMTIKDGHITGELSGIKVSANDISAGRLDAATIEVVNLNAANITVGTINGQQIASGAIDLSKLGSDVTNKLADTEEDVAKAVEDAKNAIKTANDISIGGRNLVIGSSPNVTNSSYPVVEFNLSTPLVPGEEYTIQFWGALGREWIGLYLNGGNNFVGVFTCNDSKTYGCLKFKMLTHGAIDYSHISIFAGPNGTGSATTITKVKLEKGNRATDWTPAPEDVYSSINTASIKNWCYDGNLAWMNGAKIYANTIVSDAIATDAITAVKIKAGAITADKLAANAVTAGTIAAGSITTDKLSAKAITSEKIATDAVTADKILAKSITAAKIAAGTITSDEIASGTIKAANINVTDLVGNSAFINSLKSNTVIVGLQNDINGISVGGRNLLKNSNGIYLNSSDGGIQGNSIREPHSVSVVTDGKWNAYTWVHDLLSVSLDSFRPGDVYTLSVDVKTTNLKNLNTTADIGIELWKDSDHRNSIYGKIKPNMNGIWQRVSCSYTLVHGEVTSALMVVRGYDGGDNGLVVEYRNFKLEKGNRATDWTPAPEDVDSLISAAQSTANSANSLASTAKSTADSANVLAELLNKSTEKSYEFIIDLTGSQYDQNLYYPALLNNSIPGDLYHTYICMTRLDNHKANWATHQAGCSSLLKLHVQASGWGCTYGAGWIEANEYTWCPKPPAYVDQCDYTSRIVYYLRGGGYYHIFSPVLNDGATIYTTSTNIAFSDYPFIVAPTSAPYNGYTYTPVTTIGTWCYNNDITYINGGKIYTGTVTADQLAANSVTAGKINVSSLSAISANIGTVTAGTIQSNNYVKDVSGMKLSLTDGSWDSKYTKIDGEGKIECSNLNITGGSINIQSADKDFSFIRMTASGGQSLSISPTTLSYNLKDGSARTAIVPAMMSLYSNSSGIECYCNIMDNQLTLGRTQNSTTSSTIITSTQVKSYDVIATGTGTSVSLNSLASSLAGLADDKVLKSNRGWYPNGKSLYAVPPGVYSTNPGAMPGNLAGLNSYGTLLILRENNYQTAIYMSVVGQLAIWASNSNAWSIIKS